MKKGDGVDCKCAASSCHDCGCGADWTPSEVYELREKLRVAREALNYCKTTFDWEHFPEELEVINKALAELGER